MTAHPPHAPQEIMLDFTAGHAAAALSTAELAPALATPAGSVQPPDDAPASPPPPPPPAAAAAAAASASSTTTTAVDVQQSGACTPTTRHTHSWLPHHRQSRRLPVSAGLRLVTQTCLHAPDLTIRNVCSNYGSGRAAVTSGWRVCGRRGDRSADTVLRFVQGGCSEGS